jgi:hypothetical protein
LQRQPLAYGLTSHTTLLTHLLRSDSDLPALSGLGWFCFRAAEISSSDRPTYRGRHAAEAPCRSLRKTGTALGLQYMSSQSLARALRHGRFFALRHRVYWESSIGRAHTSTHLESVAALLHFVKLRVSEFDVNLEPDGGRKISSKMRSGDELGTWRRARVKNGDLAWSGGASTEVRAVPGIASIAKPAIVRKSDAEQIQWSHYLRLVRRNRWDFLIPYAIVATILAKIHPDFT